MPEARCWNRHQLNPNKMYVPSQLAANPLNCAYDVGPSESDHSHQTNKGIPVIDIAIAVKR